MNSELKEELKSWVMCITKEGTIFLGNRVRGRSRSMPSIHETQISLSPAYIYNSTTEMLKPVVPLWCEDSGDSSFYVDAVRIIEFSANGIRVDRMLNKLSILIEKVRDEEKAYKSFCSWTPPID